MKITTGNLFNEIQAEQGLVNPVNCVGVMGAGLALAFKNKYPAMFDEYKNICNSGRLIPGYLHIYDTHEGIKIINFPTKKHWKEPSKIEYIAQGLDTIAQNYSSWDIKSLSIPPLGCGLGGLKWADVYPLICKKLGHIQEIEIVIYAPKEHRTLFTTDPYKNDNFTAQDIFCK